MVYVLSGKGSVAGSDLARTIIEKCQDAGALWDSDLPAYTLDFATQIPSVSKSIREGKSDAVIEAINSHLQKAEAAHNRYLILCLTAHQLIPRLETNMICLDLWKALAPHLQAEYGPIAYLGTLESLPQEYSHFLTLPDHADRIGDLITSVKRGYSRLGMNYAAHPRHLIKTIMEQFKTLGAERFFIGHADLHGCKQDLLQLGVVPSQIVDVVEVAADLVIESSDRQLTTEFLDAAADARMHLRYKYLTHSDSPQTEKKTQQLHQLIDRLAPIKTNILKILDIGGSSTGHALDLTKQLATGHSEVTLLDISKASLQAAQPYYAEARGVSATMVHGDIQSFKPSQPYNAALCLGVLLCIASDRAFRSTLSRIADMLAPGGLLLTRDSLHNKPEKTYMAFGGVIRNRTMYEHTFNDFGLELLSSNEFVIDQPIRRTILTAAWRKHE